MRTIWTSDTWTLRIIYMETIIIKFNVYWVSVYFVKDLGCPFPLEELARRPRRHAATVSEKIIYCEQINWIRQIDTAIGLFDVYYAFLVSKAEFSGMNKFKRLWNNTNNNVNELVEMDNGVLLVFAAECVKRPDFSLIFDFKAFTVPSVSNIASEPESSKAQSTIGVPECLS